MLQSHVHPASAPILITPECHAPGCHADGDQFTMVLCCECGAWYCPEHIAAGEGVRLVKRLAAPLTGLTYYVGICQACAQTSQSTSH
jgi:hypothetical protein